MTARGPLPVLLALKNITLHNKHTDSPPVTPAHPAPSPLPIIQLSTKSLEHIGGGGESRVVI